MKMKVTMCCIAMLALTSMGAFAGTAYYGSCEDTVKFDDSGIVQTLTYQETGIKMTNPNPTPDGETFNEIPQTPGGADQAFGGGAADLVFEATFKRCPIDSEGMAVIDLIPKDGGWMQVRMNYETSLVYGAYNHNDSGLTYLPAALDQNGTAAMTGEPITLRIEKTSATELTFSYDDGATGSFTVLGTATVDSAIGFSPSIRESYGEYTDDDYSADYVVSNILLSGEGIVDTNAAPPAGTGVCDDSENCPAEEVPAAPVLVASSPFAIAGNDFSLTAPAGAVGDYTWTKDGGAALATTTATLEFSPLETGDAGTYAVSYDDGAGAKDVINISFDLNVLPAGNELPLTGLLGLGLLAGACVLGGSSVLRRKK